MIVFLINNVRKSIIFFLFATWFSQSYCFANDTLKLLKPVLLDNIGREYAPGYLLIDRKNFQVGYNPDNSHFGYFTYSHNKYSQVYFRNCDFSVSEALEKIPEPNITSGFYIIDSCNLKYLPLAYLSGDLIIASSNLNVLTAQNTENLRLDLSGDTNISVLNLRNNRNLALDINQCSFEDSSMVQISNSSIDQFNFGYNKNSGFNIYFSNDTINWFSTSGYAEDEKVLRTYRKWYKYKNVFTFYKCHINADFTFFENMPNSTFIFDKCTFGPNVYLADMAIDELIIRNCLIIPEQLAIGFREKNEPVRLGLINSSISNIRFDFASNMSLSFDSSHTKDIITNSYKSLLEKFENEGKERSYKFVDLQYRKYKDKKSFHFLNSIWWNHGYMPALVFVWTVFFLILFFIINLSCWTQMNQTYEIVEPAKASLYKQKNKKGAFYSIVLLYTILIFFSLRVSFEKLNFKRLRYVYLFLIQYLVGLLCLVFIIRFVIKL